MLLRKFEAYGFKSFADKIEMEFGQGITAIVGPNGSGKSNISDAIRWVLGEQSIRTLRGAKMEDVIFAGSSERRPLGAAEVSLIFDNSDGLLPLDFNEVTITRRIFRSGDSEYYINKSLCRLKDIHDLLAGTGLGRDAMAVIGQNRVDEVLNNKAEERRLLFEEAAGITKYKQRKREALRKLEDTEQNLSRVTDITSEIETQLIPLAESAVRTTQFNQLQKELTVNQVTLLLKKIQKAEGVLNHSVVEQERLRNEEITYSTQLNKTEAEQESATAELQQKDAQLKTIEEEIRHISMEVERADGKIAVLREKEEYGKQTDERLTQEKARLEWQSNELIAHSGENQQKIAAKQEQKQEIDKELQAKAEQYQAVVSSIERLEQQLQDGQERTFNHLQELVDARNELRATEKELALLKNKQSQLEREHNEHCTQHQQAEIQYKNLLAEKNELQTKLQEQRQQIQLVNQDKAELEHRFAELSGQEKRLTEQVNELSSRRKILSDMQQEYEGFSRGIKSILKSKGSWRDDICGAVAQILTVPDAYVTAVEIALGGALQHIITENEETAKQAIRFLKQNNLGRATFLPLNTVRAGKPRDFEVRAAKSKGAVGFAAQLVSCEPRFQGIVDYLLGRTVVAENVDDALAIARQASFSVKIVTLDGEVINPGGSMTGGSVQRREASFLGRGNEIQNITARLDELKKQQVSLQQAILAAQNKMGQADESLNRLQTHCRGWELRLAELAAVEDMVQADCRRLLFSVETIAKDISLCSREQTEAEQKIQATQARIVELENRDNDHKQQVALWQETLKNLLQEKEQVNETITELKVIVSAVTQELVALNGSQAHSVNEIAALSGKIQALTREQEENAQQLEQFSQELAQTILARSAMEEQINRLTKEQETVYGAKLNLLAALQKFDKAVKDCRRRCQDAQARLHEIEMLHVKYQYEIDHCQDQLKNYYALSLEEAQAYFCDRATEEILKDIERLENGIASLGPVNPAAIEEHEKLQERYQFLQQQSEDLITARDALSSIINEIDTTMAKQFKAAFQTINDYFGDIFNRLFGGGKACLELVEPDNLLNTGIEILVEPPGKKRQNLTLLSGGERALTVIALLFAFLAYRPAPFCVVDEIDAALDEANVQRFGNFLRDYAQNTQFIVVTHRKGTMEAADIMHGVTMEESGISRLVSVKFIDKAG
ncbi:smcs flexible hinge [Lucifera butyrica]|uniref:Chromosome partition protein Smc n=1 Tax=Lucifera butyrica TaxID=1351585 RepID=A0A498R2N3_9FIRM|nr:chromosome segregation protein SMC [Lucifera butyrica]VBB05651.1 smcs flexible hinge [Lucifera butyrica]